MFSTLYLGFDKIIWLLISILKTSFSIGLLENFLIVITIKNNKVKNGGNSKTDKIYKILAKAKNFKILSKITKTRYLKQTIFLSSKTSNILFIKNYSD